MIRKVCCDKTRQYIQGFGDQNPLLWTDIIRLRNQTYNQKALDLIAKLICMKATERIDVNEALHHEFLQSYIPVIPIESGCPFKVAFLFLSKKNPT